MTQPITFSVVSSTLTSTTLELDGSTTFESLPIETLTFRHSTILPLGGKFLKTASAATINVSLTDYTNLGNEAVPFPSVGIVRRRRSSSGRCARAAGGR